MQATKGQERELYIRKQCFPLLFVAFSVPVLSGLFLSSCTKPATEEPIQIDTPPTQPSGSTGNIQEFTITDSLIGHNRQTTIKWYVTSTNRLTEVTLNGTKVGFSGAVQSGPLSQTTVFTLALNNNMQLSKTVRVADEITTLLWNDGKKWITNDTRTRKDSIIKSSKGGDSLIQVWESTFTDNMRNYYRDFRTSFFLDGTSKEEQLSTNFPKPKSSGKFAVTNLFPSTTGYSIIWKQRRFDIDTLTISNKELVLRIDTLTSNFQPTFNRIRYIPEF